MRKNAAKSSRVLTDLMESAQELSAYGLVSKSDMARMKLLCIKLASSPSTISARSYFLSSVISQQSKAIRDTA